MSPRPSLSSSSYSNGSSSPPSPSSSFTAGSGPSQPSARFLYNQAAHSFLLRQHASTLDVLDTLFRQLPRPKREWSCGAAKEGRDREREEVRRKAVILWITCLACVYTDRRREQDAHTLGSSLSDGRGKHQRSPAGSSGEDGLFSDGPDELYRHLVHRSQALYTPQLSSSAPANLLPIISAPLPPAIAHTLILTSVKLGLPSTLARDLVVVPFLSSLPPSFTSTLAAQSRQRETREGSLERLRGSEGWPGEMLDGYDKVVEGWAVTVLGQHEGRIREASELVGQDRVLGRAKKEELLQTLTHLPPLTPSPPANISLLPLPNHSHFSTLLDPPPRPSSPALSDAGSDSSIATATPNNFRGKAKSVTRPPANGGSHSAEETTLVHESTGWSYSAFTERLRRFVARPAGDDRSPVASSASTGSARVSHPLVVALRSRLSHLGLPASVLLFLIFAVVGLRRWWARRARVMAVPAAAGAARDVRARLGKSVLARLLG